METVEHPRRPLTPPEEQKTRVLADMTGQAKRMKAKAPDFHHLNDDTVAPFPKDQTRSLRTSERFDVGTF